MSRGILAVVGGRGSGVYLFLRCNKSRVCFWSWMLRDPAARCDYGRSEQCGTEEQWYRGFMVQQRPDLP